MAPHLLLQKVFIARRKWDPLPALYPQGKVDGECSSHSDRQCVLKGFDDKLVVDFLKSVLKNPRCAICSHIFRLLDFGLVGFHILFVF